MKEIVQFQVAFSGYEQRDNRLYIEGFASTPEIDRYNSIVNVESFGLGITNYLKNPVILLGHNPDKAIGIMIDYRITNEGLRIKAEISKDEDNIYADITEGRTKGFSIGFIPLKSEYQTRTGKPLKELTEQEYNELEEKDVVRVIKEIELVEISVVNIPANPSSLFSLTKAVRAYFDKIEKRSIIDMQRRVLISDNENPFIDEVKKTGEAEEETQEAIEEEVKEEEKQEESEEEVTEESEPTENIADLETSEEVEADGEIPSPVEQEDQTEDEEEAKEVIEELSIDNLLQQMESMATKMTELQNQLSNKPVNKPLIYSINQPKDQFADTLFKAKYGQ